MRTRSGFAFIPDKGILMFLWLGSLLVAFFVWAVVDVRKEMNLKEQMNQGDLPPRGPERSNQGLRLVVLISTLVYLVAVAAVMLL